MLRYNHSLVEKKWLQAEQEKPRAGEGLPAACTVLIPKDHAGVDLENARLLVLTDFFASLSWNRSWVHLTVGGTDRLQNIARRLGITFQPAVAPVSCGLALLPRDFAHLGNAVQGEQMLLTGRLLGGMDLEPLLMDVGGDVLRLYFLHLGPPERDYTFNWHVLASAHRFVQKVWRLAQGANLVGPQSGEPALADVAALVKARAAQGKPHTALAALMGFLKEKTALSAGEVGAVARLLRPFTPFLSAELMSMAPVQDQDHRQGDQTDA